MSHRTRHLLSPRGLRIVFSLFSGCLVSMALAPATLANHSVTDLLSIGPNGGNANVAATFQGASKDATHVFFRTDESLVAADTDFSFDIYERFGTTTTLMSIGSQPGVDLDTSFVAASSDGSRLFFSTRDQLVPQDTDAGLDIYERSGGVTTLFPSTSAATAATGAVDYQLFPQGSSQDGLRQFFTTAQQLSAADTDGLQDVYERQSDGTIVLISTGPNANTNPLNPAYFDGASDDASHAFFHTYESLLTADTDSQIDIYDRSGTSTSLVSTAPGTGNGSYDAVFGGNSQDGSRIFFTTAESLVAFPDSDGGYQDVYERSGGTTKLVSYGPNSFDGPYTASFGGNSADGTKVFFVTNEPLVSADMEGQVDVYERSSGSTRFVSTVSSTSPPGGCSPNCSVNADFAGASQDGLHVFFRTEEILHTADFSFYPDVYDRFAGDTRLVSLGGCCTYWYFQAASQDGNRVFFTSGSDTWERFNGSAAQIQTGQFRFASQDGTRVIFHSNSQLVSGDTDNSQDVYVSAVNVDLSASMTDTPDPVRVGAVLTYQATVTNNGIGAARSVGLTDLLPKNVRLRSASSDHGHCAKRGLRRLECNLAGLSDGESAAVTIKVRPTRAGTTVNTATVRGESPDLALANNTVAATTTVLP
jgi:uncharacterized repeat protein (TIGR01451 family)